MSAISIFSAKQWLRLDEDFLDDDELIQECIDSAEGWIETYTSHVLESRPFQLLGDGCWQDIFLYPISNIPEGTKHEVKSLYTSFLIPNLKEVSMNIGYNSYADIPKQLISAAKKIIVFLYENRDAYSIDDNTDVKMLVNQLRRGIVVV